jgi:hypothetical protein
VANGGLDPGNPKIHLIPVLIIPHAMPPPDKSQQPAYPDKVSIKTPTGI